MRALFFLTFVIGRTEDMTEAAGFTSVCLHRLTANILTDDLICLVHSRCLIIVSK